MSDSPKRKRSGHVPDTRYVCPLCGRRVETLPLYVHQLVWHRESLPQVSRPDRDALIAEAAEDPDSCDCNPAEGDFCWHCEPWRWSRGGPWQP